VAILMIFDASSNSLANYDEVTKQLEAAGQGHPVGRLHHVATPKENGYLIVDVWESQEALDRFGETVGPILEKLGGPAGQAQIYPVHNLVKGAE
jgi:hypothetical protein